jgi:hypothetical protein
VQAQEVEVLALAMAQRVLVQVRGQALGQALEEV